MAPEERKTQERWAQSLIQRAGVCPAGYTWTRIHDGYRCAGGNGPHIMTDESIAEGKGALMFLPNTRNGSFRWGPYYRDDRGNYVYAGDPSTPCPKSFDEDGRANWDAVWRLLPGLTKMPEAQEDVDRLNDEIARLIGNREFQNGGPGRSRTRSRMEPGMSGSNIMINGRRISGMRPGSDFVYNSGQRTGMSGSRLGPRPRYPETENQRQGY
jgi:hypothetical protein